MELDGYVDRLRTEFAAISEVAGDDVREVAERLVAPLESAVRLVMLPLTSTGNCFGVTSSATVPARNSACAERAKMNARDKWSK